jgi:hypothetical protein
MYPEKRETDNEGGAGSAPVKSVASNKLIFPLVLGWLIAVVEFIILIA